MGVIIMEYGWLNIGSLLFGLIALIIPIITFMRQDNYVSNNLGVISGISISSCAISLCMQIFYANHLVNIEDFTAMMDILGNVSNVSAVLLIATIVLNIITHMVCNGNKSQI